jgi:hypothetical protein
MAKKEIAEVFPPEFTEAASHLGNAAVYAAVGLAVIVLVLFYWKKFRPAWETAQKNIFTLHGLMIFSVWFVLLAGGIKLKEVLG